MKKALTLSLIVSSSIFAAGYQIPNNSINSAALATANVANAHGADAAYYNPANMIRNEDRHIVEGSVTYASLSPINYKSSNGVYDIDSEKYTTFIPSLHYVSKKLNDAGVRLGFSIVAPAGLTREWKDFPASATSDKYALQTIEFNPSVAIPVNNKLSVGFGFRYVRAEGEIKLDGSVIPLTMTTTPYTLDMKGKDTSACGYNLALSYQATEAWNISATYRSKISLHLEGDADAYVGAIPILFGGASANRSSDASLDTPIPANLIIATAYTFDTGTTVEVTYDRTMWSAIKETNFEFNDPYLEGTLGVSKAKKWHDTEAYRMGITQKLDNLTLMGGIAYSTNAANEDYVSFSSPESDSMTYALGGRYQVNESLELGLAVLYADYDTRKVSQPTNAIGVNGTLSDRTALTVTAGAIYKF